MSWTLVESSVFQAAAYAESRALLYLLFRSDSPEVAELKRQLHWAYLKIQVLEERLRLQRIQKYGPGSEKLGDRQLELLELEPGVSNVEVQAESARDPLPSGTGEARRTRRQRPHPGRQELPADLPRVERVIDCTPQQCQCSHCGQARTVIGYETSEQLDVGPAKYFVLVTTLVPISFSATQE